MQNKIVEKHEKYEAEYLKTLLKLNKQIEDNKIKMEKVEIDGEVNQFKKGKEVDENKVHLIHKKKEFSSGEVRSNFFCPYS